MFLKLTDIFSSPTVNIERVITKLVVRIGCLKQETVGTEFLLWNLSDAFIIFITLLRIREESIWFRTSERSAAAL